MRAWLILLGALSTLPANAAPTTNASSAILNVYAAYLSESAFCTNPVQIVNNGAAQPFNMTTSPTLGQGQVPPKVYNCLIIEMSDRIDFVPTTTAGNCVAGTTYTRYVCQTGFSSYNPITGASITCSGSSQTGEDHVFVYVSTASSSTGGSTGNNAFMPPTSSSDAAHGLNLSTPIDATKGGGTFIFNTDGKVDGGQNPCDLQPPTFSFRSL